MQTWLRRSLVAALACLALTEVIVIAPQFDALLPMACAVWLILPGVALIRELVRSTGGGRVIPWLVGPSIGLGFSVFGLLLWWIVGVQNALALVLAPLFSWIIVLAARRWGVPTLRLPVFDRRDIAAVVVAMFVVPLVTFAPYDHVREPTPEGDAYRAYFTADFVWAMTVTGELAKGEVPPANPFLKDEPLHYYWMSHLLSGALYRNLYARHMTAEQVVLLDGLVFGFAFVPFFYALARIAGGSPWFSATAVIAAFVANSYEGLERLLVYQRHGTPLDTVRMVNIDAVTRWFYDGMPVDGLQRMLLYQPHHLTGYVLALAALWLVGTAEDVTETSVALWAGILLGLGLLFSVFNAIILGVAVTGLFAYRLIVRRAWLAIWQAAVLGAMPVIVAVTACVVLGYTDTDRTHGRLLQFGLNAVALHHLPLVLLLNFGPLLAAGIAGMLRVSWMRRQGAAAVALVITAFAFYFFVDVPDEGHVWVGWRSGHLLLIAFAVMGASALTAAWNARSMRAVIVAGLVLLLTPALPTAAIDVYNAQDITNHGRGPAGPWTVFVSKDERAALEWLRRTTSPHAIVQADPYAHHAATWAYLQAFAERRGIAGLPISMIPLHPYQRATASVTFGIFHAQKAEEAREVARYLGIDYLFVGKAERDAYPETTASFDAHPELFVPVFRNDAATIYDVRRR